MKRRAWFVLALAAWPWACAGELPHPDFGPAPDCVGGAGACDRDAGATDGGPSLNGGPDTPPPGRPDAGGPRGTVVRVVAANLTSGNNQAYLEPGIRILQGLKPDVTLIQEFNYATNAAEELRAFVDEAFGPEFVYFREAGSSIPNGVVSRYPIVASGEWEDTLAPDRDFAWARIDIPGDIDLWAISVHLLGSNATSRASEADALLALIAKHVPASDYVALGGDFNTRSRSETCIRSFAVAFDTDAPHPDDGAPEPNGNTNMNRNLPYDWVLRNASLATREVPVRVGDREFLHGLVFDSRVYQPLADVAPVVTGDSDGPVNNMQHMAVVRDFAFE